MFLESSYPLQKGSNGSLTSRYILDAYNCVHFYYHMHGATMGRLNVFVQRRNNIDTEMLWRLVGDQSDEWKAATVKIERKSFTDLHKVRIWTTWELKKFRNDCDRYHSFCRHNSIDKLES